MTDKKKNPRRTELWLDVLHLVLGLIIVVLSVLAFLSPEEHLLFFPVIFFLSAVVFLVNGVVLLQNVGHRQKNRLTAFGKIGAGGLLLLLAVVSAVVMR